MSQDTGRTSVNYICRMDRVQGRQNLTKIFLEESKHFNAAIMFKRLHDKLMRDLLEDVHSLQERLAMLTQVFVRRE